MIKAAADSTSTTGTSFPDGFAAYSPEIELSHQGDWANPGIYCLHHLPTGLEYVGASVCVSARLRQHLLRPDAWLDRLSACVIVGDHGPQIVEHDGTATLLFSPSQIQALDSFALARSLATLADKGVCANVQLREILPVFLEKPKGLSPATRAARLANAEKAHIARRNPALNRLRESGYGPSGPMRTDLGPPPKCLSDESIKAMERFFATSKMAAAARCLSK